MENNALPSPETNLYRYESLVFNSVMQSSQKKNQLCKSIKLQMLCGLKFYQEFCKMVTLSSLFIRETRVQFPYPAI